MEIVDMKKEDFHEVYDLWLTCASIGLNNLDESQQGLAASWSEILRPVLSLKKSGKIVGVILVGSDGRRGYIYHTAVHLGHRRQGIAGKL